MNLCPVRFLRPLLRVVPAVLLGLAASGAFAVELVTFDSDPTGGKANGFMSVDSSHVIFNDTVGSGLDVGDYGSQSNFTNGLAVNDDTDGGILEMLFDCMVTSLSLDFGNDDPSYTNPGDLAVLTTYVNALQVGQTTVVMNRNDDMDQTITSTGPAFNRATFAYTDPATLPFTGGGGANIGLIEVVDNIRFECVPEPTTLGLFALALAAHGLRRSRRGR